MEKNVVKDLARPALSFWCLSAAAGRMFHGEGLECLLQAELHFHCREKQTAATKKVLSTVKACVQSVIADVPLWEKQSERLLSFRALHAFRIHMRLRVRLFYFSFMCFHSF